MAAAIMTDAGGRRGRDVTKCVEALLCKALYRLKPRRRTTPHPKPGVNEQLQQRRSSANA